MPNPMAYTYKIRPHVGPAVRMAFTRTADGYDVEIRIAGSTFARGDYRPLPCDTTWRARAAAVWRAATRALAHEPYAAAVAAALEV